MKKYLLVMSNTWSEVFTYRFNFILWRFRSLVSILPIYFIWLAIFSSKDNVFGYNASLMLTYVLGVSFVTATVISSRTYAIGEEINSGNLSNYLIKPINYFLYYFFKDIGDKAMNIFFAIIELSLIFVLLKPPIFIQKNLELIALSIVAIFIAVIIYFLFNTLIGFIGFWSPEVWAPRFIFVIIVSFFAGTYFPLDILPKPLFSIFSLTPFPYLIFFPLKIYLGNISYLQIYQGIVISLSWVLILYLFVRKVWRIGLKSYTAHGK